MKETTNYKLKKIDLTDAPPDITVLNPNFDTIDTKLKEAETHKNDSVAHVTASDKNYWGGKAAGNHNHDSAYAPKYHSDNSSIHVTTAEKNAWNGKAAGSHGHSLASLGAAPSGYGVGEELLGTSIILDPLNISLKSGTYGYWGGKTGAINSPNGDAVFACHIYDGDFMWRSVILIEMNGTGNIWKNNYYSGSGWTGWRELGTAKATYSSAWINAGSGTYTYELGSYYGSLIISTGISTGTNSVTNKALVMPPWTANDQWLQLVWTINASIQVAFKGTYFLVKASNLSESAFISWAALRE